MQHEDGDAHQGKAGAHRGSAAGPILVRAEHDGPDRPGYKTSAEGCERQHEAGERVACREECMIDLDGEKAIASEA